MKNKSLLTIIMVVFALLLIPLIAMQFTEEVDWNFFDFVVAGVLLTGAGILIDFALKRIRKSEYRIVTIVLVVVAFILVWAELAVGVFGTPLAGS